MGCTPLPGNERLVLKLGLLEARASNMMPALAATLDLYHRHEAERFAQEGPGWQPLSDLRVAERGSSNPILNFTGDLEESFAGGGGLMSELLTTDGWESSSTVEYAGYHQFPGQGHNVQREIVDISHNPGFALLCRVVLQGWLMDGMLSEFADSSIESSVS